MRFEKSFGIQDEVMRPEFLFILNSSAHVLSATNRFDPDCEPHHIINNNIYHSLVIINSNDSELAFD